MAYNSCWFPDDSNHTGRSRDASPASAASGRLWYVTQQKFMLHTFYIICNLHYITSNPGYIKKYQQRTPALLWFWLFHWLVPGGNKKHQQRTPALCRKRRLLPSSRAHCPVHTSPYKIWTADILIFFFVAQRLTFEAILSCKYFFADSFGVASCGTWKTGSHFQMTKSGAGGCNHG